MFSTRILILIIAIPAALGIACGPGPLVTEWEEEVEGVNQSVASIELTPGPIAVRHTETLQLSARVRNANGQSFEGAEVTWSSSDYAVATVDVGGLLVGTSLGTTTITASADGVSGTTTVWVEPLDAGLQTVLATGASGSDGRIEAAREAVEYWNSVFADLSLHQPFGTMRFFEENIQEDLLEAYSNAVLEGAQQPTTPNAFTTIAFDVVLALSDASIISFATTSSSAGRWLVGIRTDRVVPLNLPNVPRNLVAHELGHVLGLGHNSDPTLLMCGRPASCRPGAFQSDEPRFFELTESERALLVLLHS